MKSFKLCRPFCWSLVVMVGSGVASSDDSSFSKLASIQQSELDRLAEELREVKLAVREERDRRKIKQLRARESELEKTIRAVENGWKPLDAAPEIDSFRPEVGEVGTLKARTLRVLNVLGPDRVLVVPVKTSFTFGLGSSQQFYDKTGSPIVIVGMPTEDLASNQEFGPHGLFTVVGNENYQSVSGAKTASVLRWFDVQELREGLPGRTAKKDAARPKKRVQEYPLRQWTDASGRYTVEARFAGRLRNRVYLRRPDGEKIIVDLAKLSGEDRQWINDLK